MTKLNGEVPCMCEEEGTLRTSTAHLRPLSRLACEIASTINEFRLVEAVYRQLHAVVK